MYRLQFLIFSLQLLLLIVFLSCIFFNHIKAREPPTNLLPVFSEDLLFLFILWYEKGSVYKTGRIKRLLIKKLLMAKFWVKLHSKFDRFVHAPKIFVQLQRNVSPKKETH